MAEGIGGALPLFGSAVSSLFGSAGSAAAAQGSLAAADAFTKAEGFAFTNAHLAKVSGDILTAQLGRKVNMAFGKIGTQAAANGGEGEGGSAGDVLRMSAQEGGLAKAVQSVNTALQVSSYQQQGTALEGQAAQMTATASQQQSSSSGQLFGGLFSAGAGLFTLFSDDRLKEDIQLLETREDGINLYKFKFIGTDVYFRGVLAQEVKRFKPWCVEETPSGYLMVDYEKLGLDRLYGADNA